MKMTILRFRNSASLLRTAVVVGAVLILVGTPAAARAFTFTTIDVPGATGTQASGINPPGVIVGNYTDASAMIHGFAEYQGTFVTIDFPGATGTEASGINPPGVIVGNYTDASSVVHGIVEYRGTFVTLD